MKTKILFVTSAAVLLAALPLQAADVREGLVAYWPLNTASGDYPMITPDVVASNDLTGAGKPSADIIAGGKFGNCVQFFGTTTDYLNFINPFGADTGLPVANNGSWTYSVWVKGVSNQVNQTTYFCESSSYAGQENQRFAMEGNGAARTRYFIRDNNGTVKNQLVGSTNTLDDSWHHVAYTYDASSGRFLVYVDGQPDCTNTFTYSQNRVQWDQVGIGALVRSTVGVPFAGQMDDVALWARVLSQGEIQDVMTNSISTPVPQFAPAVTKHPTGVTNLFEGDSFTLSAAVYGSRPLYYQWLKDGTNYPGANASLLALSSVTTSETGQYQLVVTNTSGSATSLVAQITVNTFAGPDLTNGMVAYWPLDTVVGVKTPDLVSAYDLTINNMASSNVVPGKWGNALAFTGANSQYARRIHNAGDALPAYSRSNFTVSFWAKAPLGSTGWAFAESSTANNFPAFCMGILSASSDKMDGFVRDNSGNPAGDHRLSSGVFWDDTWHHAVWVQRDVGGSPKAQLYIDGILDPANNLNPRYPVNPNNTALGAFARATPAQFFTGLIDEVAIWERPLSPDEVALLTTSYITNPPSRLTPLVVNAFKSDLPAVANGDSTVLRWDVPANATQVIIDPLGDVTSKTVSGVGSTNISVTNTTAYVLTVKRGAEQVKATNTVGAVEGVTANWNLLDNFDFYQPAALASYGWWSDIGGVSVFVVTPTNCNRMARTTQTASGAYLKLNNLTVNSNQSSTLFFRMIPQTAGSLIRHVVGITDKPANFYYQMYDVNNGNGSGPVLHPTISDPTQTPGDWLMAAVNFPHGGLTFDTNVLQVGAVYSVWIDVTNVFMADGAPGNEDIFSVYIQKQGDTGRTAIFTNFVSDRDLLLSDSLTGGFPTDPLTRVYLCGGVNTDSALFDDFYLSKSGYNDTVPRAFGYAGPAPTLQLQWTGSQWQILFQGKLLESSSVSGPWTDVTGATSPYPVSTIGGPKFYRAVCN
jgi:hypothetical protein